MYLSKQLHQNTGIGNFGAYNLKITSSDPERFLAIYFSDALPYDVKRLYAP